MAPIRRQFRIDLPLYVFGETLPFVGLNFPYLLPSQYKPLPPKFSGGGKNADFFKIADMDSIISREFKNELPLVITARFCRRRSRRARSSRLNTL